MFEDRDMDNPPAGPHGSIRGGWWPERGPLQNSFSRYGKALKDRRDVNAHLLIPAPRTRGIRIQVLPVTRTCAHANSAHLGDVRRSVQGPDRLRDRHSGGISPSGGRQGTPGS